jgi:hypothetical protein
MMFRTTPVDNREIPWEICALKNPQCSNANGALGVNLDGKNL